MRYWTLLVLTKTEEKQDKKTKVKAHGEIAVIITIIREEGM